MFKGSSLSELAHKQNDSLEIAISSNQFHQSVCMMHHQLFVIHCILEKTIFVLIRRAWQKLHFNDFWIIRQKTLNKKMHLKFQ